MPLVQFIFVRLASFSTRLADPKSEGSERPYYLALRAAGMAANEDTAVFLRDAEGGIGVAMRRAARHAVPAVPLTTECANEFLGPRVPAVMIWEIRHVNCCP